MELSRLSWEEAAERASGGLLVIPVGSTEQHGPHLPLATDTLIAQELARRLAAHRGDVLVAPALPYGASGEHRGFPGTISMGTEALATVLVELCRSADDFAAVLILSAHGGNREALAAATALLGSEGRRVRSWSPPPPPGGDAHAGHTETSVVLALEPERVRVPMAVAGDTRPLAAVLPTLRSAGTRSVSANGVLGDPTGADASAGENILAFWEARLVTDMDGWP